jgi:transcriptional regulator with XRE-family HTH domain
MDAQKLVAQNLSRIRLAKGMSQEALAEDSGLSRAYVSGVERAKENPTVDVLDRLAHALGVGIRDFFDPLRPRDQSPRALPRGPKRRL